MTTRKTPQPKTATLCVTRNEIAALNSSHAIMQKGRLVLNLADADPQKFHFLNREIVDVKVNPEPPDREDREAFNTWQRHMGYQAMGVSFPQILGYFVIQDENGLILNYQRPSKQGEQKLSDFRSIGIGGHCDIEDLVMDGSQIDHMQTLLKSCTRELEEEIGYIANFDFRLTGADGKHHLLSDPTEPASAVHLGLVKVLQVIRANLKESLDEILDLQWSTLEELQAAPAGTYEPWSAMILEDQTFITQEITPNVPAQA